MKILVAGCAGFIGWKVTEFALRKGHEVVGVDNLTGAYDIRLKQWRLSQIRELPGLSFTRLDVTDRAGLEELFSEHRFDVVVNLAARAGIRQSLIDPWAYYDANVIGTLNLVTCSKDHDVRRFVLASTSSVYSGCPLPFHEDQCADRPLSPYAASKKSAEALCHAFAHLYGIDTTVLRYFTVYGPAGRPDMSLFRFVQLVSESRPVTVFGDGEQSRDFTYIDDIAQGTLAALKPDGYEIINLGGGREATVLDAIHLIEDLVGKRATIVHRPPHPADMPSTRASIDKARSRLGWAPQVTLEEGLEHLVMWYRENRSWAKDIGTG